MRSLLFVPADGGSKLDKAFGCGADAVIVDLEDSIAPDRKAEARASAAAFLGKASLEASRPRLFVRINALATGLADADLDAVVPARPDAIMLPKAEGGAAVVHAEAKLAAREARSGLEDGHVKIVAQAIETVYVDFRNLAGLRSDTEEARRDGFSARLAIHPAQAPVINEVFTPTADSLAKAQAIIAAFDAAPGAGVIAIDGVMYDRPHLLRAKGVLTRAKAAGLA